MACRDPRYSPPANRPNAGSFLLACEIGGSIPVTGGPRLKGRSREGDGVYRLSGGGDVKRLKKRLFALGAILVICGGPRAAETITVDYARPGRVSSGLIFGGDVADCTPDLGSRGLGKGVRFIRGWFAMWKLIPNGSIEDYRANRNNIQDPDTWNWDDADKFTEFGRQHGLSVMACIFGCPAWLSYSDCSDHSKGWRVGVPRAWDVWEDIVTKVARRIGDRVDYYEIWNEPGFNHKYLDLRNSGLSNRRAYRGIYLHTHRAIREVDPDTPIGGPCFVGAPIKEASNRTNADRYRWLDELLGDPEIASRIDFVSYHNYQAPEYPEQHEPSNAWTKYLMLKNLGRLLPIFITEWNQHFDWGYQNEPESIPFHAGQFIHYIRSGLHGSGFFNMSACICCKRTFDDGRWVWTNVWKIASVKAGLGAGAIQAVSTNGPEGSLAVGCIGVDGSPSVLLVGHGQRVDLTLRNVGAEGPVDSRVYLVTTSNDGTSPWVEETLSPDGNGEFSLSLDMPSNAAAAVVLEGASVSATQPPSRAATDGRAPAMGAAPGILYGARGAPRPTGCRLYDVRGRMVVRQGGRAAAGHTGIVIAAPPH